MAYADRVSTAQIKPIKASDVFEPTLLGTGVAISKTAGTPTTVEGTFKDERTILYVDSACVLTIIAGNGYAGVNNVEMEFTGAGFFTVDSARIVDMKNEDGRTKGQFRCYCTSSGAPKMYVLEG